MNKPRILYFGFYNPDYSRNRVLIKGLRQNGNEVIECRVGPEKFGKYLKLLAGFFKHRRNFDVMIVGFPGQEVMFLARALTQKPIIFDAFTSHYGGYILDRKYFSENGLRAKYYKFLDRWSCRLADRVLLDTGAHIDFFVREFGLPKGKFRRIFVGSDSEIFKPGNLVKPEQPFKVHFHGSYVPLQGVACIIQAAKELESEAVEFNLIGRGQTHEKDRKLANDLGLKNVNFIGNVEYQKLADYMEQADVCLGIFGDSPKTELVIPNKIYEALAMRKPVITADTKAVSELLTDRTNVLLCRKADPEDLARKIGELRDNPELREKIAGNGYELFNSRLAEKKLGAELMKIIEEVKK